MRQDISQQDLFKEAPVWWDGLTGRRKLFVEYYCTDKTCFLNATAAFIKAYSNSGKELTSASIQSNSARLMREPKIKEAIAKLLRAQQNDEDQLNEFKILQLLKTLAFYNPADIIDKYGCLKKEMTELGDLAMCITGVEKNRDGSRKYKLFDRTKAMELLSRYLDIIRPAEGTLIVNPYIRITDKDVTELQKNEGNAAQQNSIEDAEIEDAEFEVVPELAAEGRSGGVK